VSGTRGSRAGTLTAKATDGTRDPGAGAHEPPGVWDVERSDGCPGNWREPPRPHPLGWEAMPAYNQANPGKWWVVERQSEGVVVVRGRESRPHGEGPLLHRCRRWRGGVLMSARTARSVRQTDGLDVTRALQRVLYRSATEEPGRRVHALYGHIVRDDVLARAWAEVRVNRGAPGIDGVSIADVEASGVNVFLHDWPPRCGNGRIVVRRCGGCTSPRRGSRRGTRRDPCRSQPCATESRWRPRRSCSSRSLRPTSCR
jgi:hypothetical protein